MFGGKGGVGKTTCSATTALHYAQAGRRTLIISSDLTPSLSDIFETEIGPAERPVPGVDNLWALEINPDEVMRRWKVKFGPQVYEAASALVDMPYEDVVEYAALAPGIQEEFMLDYIVEQIRDGRYDVIVWDTAPAGDTLRLLGLPRKFLEHLRMAPRMYLAVRDRLNLKKVPFLELIESWTVLAQDITSFISNPEHTEFILVTIPEALGVYQARRLVKELGRFGLPIRRMIVNHVVEEADSEFYRERRAMQQRYLALLQEEHGRDIKIIQLPLFPYEVKGVARLRELERVLFAA